MNSASGRCVVVDVGNTSTAVGLWVNGRVSHVSHCDGPFEDAEREACDLIEKSRAGSMVYISVVQKRDRKWAAVAKHAGVEFVQPTWRDFPLELDYPDPSTIGADRLADAAGAVARYGTGVVVMDFGTALTAAAITSDGVWRGGVIAPGFPLMRDYLFERTAKLPRMRIGSGKPPKIGRSTEEAMRFGAIVGYRGMVKEIVATRSRNFKQDFTLIATGGFAKWALKDSGLEYRLDPTLTLFGAGLLARECGLGDGSVGNSRSARNARSSSPSS